MPLSSCHVNRVHGQGVTVGQHLLHGPVYLCGRYKPLFNLHVGAKD